MGLETKHGFWFDLYGGTVLLAARRSDDPVRVTERRSTPCSPRTLGSGSSTSSGRASSVGPQRRVAKDVRGYLETARDEGRRVVGYGATSRAVPLLCRAGIGVELMQLLAARPDEVVLFVTDLLDDVRRTFPRSRLRGTVGRGRPRRGADRTCPGGSVERYLLSAESDQPRAAMALCRFTSIHSWTGPALLFPVWPKGGDLG